MAKRDPDVPQAFFVWNYTPLTRIVPVHDQELFQSEAGCLPVDFCELVYNLDSLPILALSNEVPRALQKWHRETHRPKEEAQSTGREAVIAPAHVLGSATNSGGWAAGMFGNKTPGNLGHHKQWVRASVITRTPLAMTYPTPQKAFTAVRRY